MPETIYDLSAKTIDGHDQNLAAYKDRVLLIVNVASKCGFTPQYAGLESLYRKFKNRGLIILGFPCDQFGHQEPGNAAEIQEFCSLTYQVSFPMFAKIAVNGGDTHPIYKYLKSQKRGLLGLGFIKWNFTKFLVDRSGTVVGRYGSAVTPAMLEKRIETLLGS